MADSLTAPGTVQTLPSSGGSMSNPPVELSGADVCFDGSVGAPSGAKKAENV